MWFIYPPEYTENYMLISFMMPKLYPYNGENIRSILIYGNDEIFVR